jgi:anti-sigma-K factor RskA
MPVFSTPLMLASVPVMPTTATRAAEPYRRAEQDCHERIDRLEENLDDLADSVRKLQALVYDQSRIMERLTWEHKPERKPESP